MKRNKSKICLAVALLAAWLPAVAFAKAPARAANKDPAPARIVPRPRTTVPFAKKPTCIVKQVWVGGSPSLGGYLKTVIEKAPEAKQKPRAPQVEKAPDVKQTPSTLQRVWVGGPPWLGGYETWK